ncbi:hypothetical protein BC628DRAFT_19851 [Trametes gibbosa]|nr:hypothetical protein BC628DRAFT_19851 [Trametes gibbosa]
MSAGQMLQPVPSVHPRAANTPAGRARNADAMCRASRPVPPLSARCTVHVTAGVVAHPFPTARRGRSRLGAPPPPPPPPPRTGDGACLALPSRCASVSARLASGERRVGAVRYRSRMSAVGRMVIIARRRREHSKRPFRPKPTPSVFPEYLQAVPLAEEPNSMHRGLAYARAHPQVLADQGDGGHRLRPRWSPPRTSLGLKCLRRSAESSAWGKVAVAPI